MQETKLTSKEKKVFEGLTRRLKVPKRKTKVQVVMGMVGLVGSGVTSVARELTRGIGAVVLDADDVRVLLRKEKTGYGHVREIVLELAEHVLAQGGNIVIDSDHIDPNKRNKLKKLTKDRGAELYFVRTVCNPDVMLGRMITTHYGSTSKDLFQASETAWRGKYGAAVDKIREFWRRTPLHYFWNSENGGSWVSKSMSFIYAEIDTTDGKKWKAEVKQVAAKLLR
ncbi:AAA family ATPase [Candidatus Wolfebacteria bacterium]|nr:AAA family ATPase [Candidatus Wolfebacteria bacterium]